MKIFYGLVIIMALAFGIAETIFNGFIDEANTTFSLIMEIINTTIFYVKKVFQGMITTLSFMREAFNDVIVALCIIFFVINVFFSLYGTMFTLICIEGLISPGGALDTGNKRLKWRHRVKIFCVNQARKLQKFRIHRKSKMETPIISLSPYDIALLYPSSCTVEPQLNQKLHTLTGSTSNLSETTLSIGKAKNSPEFTIISEDSQSKSDEPTPSRRVGSCITTGKLWYREVQVVSNGLKTIEKEPKKSSSNTIKEKVSKEKSLSYFLDHSNRVGNKASDDFKAFRLNDFRTIRKYLGISEALFKHKFDENPCYDARHKMFDPIHSEDGQFRLHFLKAEQAYFLYKNVNSYKHHLRHHRKSAIARYVGLYRIGSTFCAIEHVAFNENLLQKSFCFVRWNNEIEYYRGHSRGDATRITHSPRLYGTKNPQECRKTLLADLNFFTNVCPSFYSLAVGQADELV